MKSIVALTVLSSGLAASAYGMPPIPPQLKLQHLLEQGCAIESSFTPSRVCGQAAYDTLTCPEGSGNAKRWLLVGRVESKSINECSPTFVLEAVLPEAAQLAQPNGEPTDRQP